MNNPDTEPRSARFGLRNSARGWRWAARRLAPAALACAFAGAAQAQTYGSLDLALGRIIGEIVGDGRLRGQAVLVSPNHFIELGTGRNLRLSSLLASQSVRELRSHGARPVSGSDDEDRVAILRGEWDIQDKSGEPHLFLSIEAKKLVGNNERNSFASEVGYIPIASIDAQLLEPDIESHGRYVVQELEKDLTGGKYFLYVPPFAVYGMADRESELFKRYLLARWRPAFTGSRRFRFGGPDRFDGELLGEVFVGESILISLRVRDEQEVEVAAATVEMERGLFPSGMFGAGVPKEGDVFRDDCEGCPELVVVGPGSFEMGSPGSEAGRRDNEGPVREVTIGYAFAVGVHEVTRGEYARFVSETGRSMGDSCRTYEGGEWEERSGLHWRSPGYEQTDGHPVVCVSWDDARAYVRWLSRKTGEGYRLLSESEWEYAARGGRGAARYWGEGEAGQCRYANGGDESSKRRNSDWPWETASCDDGHARTSLVGSFGANDYGLRDALGNVSEWVEDCYHDSYAGGPLDGSARGGPGGCRRVLRGGSWNYIPRYLRSAYRSRLTTGYRVNNVGFRVARTLTP